jgi:5-methylcytosine-specific restriction enzyme subunit McrC
MNRFFQSLVSRFLHEHLEGYVVQDELRLKGMFSYDPAHNPLERSAPIQRPDYVVLKEGRTVEVLDAKYRDLWENRLPPDMLYQLALYALGRPDADRRSTILYPTTHAEAIDQVIEIQEPRFGATEARVILRAMNLLELADLLSEPSSPSSMRQRREFAHRLVFGE